MGGSIDKPDPLPANRSLVRAEPKVTALKPIEDPKSKAGPDAQDPSDSTRGPGRIARDELRDSWANTKERVGRAWQGLKVGAAVAYEKSGAKGIDQRAATRDAVRFAGWDIDKARKRIDRIDEQMANTGSSHAEFMRLSTRKLQEMATIDRLVTERAKDADRLSRHWEGKLTKPTESRKDWETKLNEADGIRKQIQADFALKEATYTEMRGRLTALMQHSGTTEQAKALILELDDMNTKMSADRNAMQYQSNRMAEQRKKMDQWDSDNRRVLGKIAPWKAIAENGRSGTTDEFRAQAAKVEAGNTTNAIAASESARTPAGKEAGTAANENLKGLSDEQLLDRIATALRGVGGIDRAGFESELGKLRNDSELGKFFEQKMGPRKFIGAWNELVERDPAYEPIKSRLETAPLNKLKEQSLIDFARAMFFELKRDPAPILEGIKWIARAMKERPEMLKAAA